MDLDTVWTWKKKKLACRIRPENGNPAGDSLRDMFAELAGVDLNELLNEMKSTKKRKEEKNKVHIDHEGDKTFKEVLYRSRVLGATALAITDMQKYDQEKSESLTQKNLRKVFTLLPKSPPPRVLREIQRERSKPLRLPDPEEQDAATAKLEKKLAKQRALRMAAIEQSELEAAMQETKLSDTQHAFLNGLTDNAMTVLPKYEGDQFGVNGPYMEGMMYLSRMADSSTKMKRKKDLILETHLKEKADAEEEEKMALNSRDNLENPVVDDNFDATCEPDAASKLYCAMSLCNWSRNPQNAQRLSSEGAVRAIMQLSLEYDEKISVYCSAAFRYMSESYDLAVSMIDEGAIATMSEVCSTRTDDFTLTNIAIALVNLTRVNGKEGQLVGEAAVVLALMNLIMLKSELGVVCVRGLYNLTCVDVSYQFIERVVRALVSLSLSGTANVKHLCAASLCNLSDLKSVRPRMVEEGAINVLTALSRGAETKTRRVCAVILQNLSAAKSVRVEMASRNSVTAAYGLSSDQDPIILRCIGLTLSRLAMEPTNCQRIIQESGISALCNIAVKYPTIPGISQPAASAFQLLTSHQAHRVIMATEGSVTAIASLLLSSVDMFTLQHSLLALCNLLCETDNHVPIIQQGLIITLIAMCEQENDLIKDFCALAFLNLSCCEDSRKHIVNSGAITAIISVAKQSSQVTKRRCSAILCNISYFTSGMHRMVSDGIIPSIVSLVLAKDIETVHYSCSALCHLCCTVDNAQLILESGAIPSVVRGAMEGDSTTRSYCGAVLSSLSFYESCRLTLCELGAITALKGLAGSSDEVTKQRCLVAFANLSCESSVHAKMIDEGVVDIIAQLANSNQEINFICCAKAMCNLACNEEKKFLVATEGGVHALLMICMVKSVDRLTKLLCIIGLNNLVDDTTIEFMLQQEIIGSMANISKIGDSNIANLCVRIFNRLSKYAKARSKVTGKGGALSSLIAMTDDSVLDTKIIATRTCCNIILDPNVRAQAIKAGILISVERCFSIESIACNQTPIGTPTSKSRALQPSRTLQQSQFRDNSFSSVQDGLVIQCLISVFSICTDAIFMEYSAKSRIPVILLRLITEAGASVDEYSIAAKSLSMLAWNLSSRVYLQQKEVFILLLNLIDVNFKVLAAEWLSAIIRFLVIGYEANVELITKRNILYCMAKINERNILKDASAVSICRSLVGTLRTFCDDESVDTADVITDGTIAILLNAVTIAKGDSKIMYDVACVLYMFATGSTEARQKASTVEAVQVIDALQTEPMCAELLAVIIASFAGDFRCRTTFAVPEIITTIVNLVDLSLALETMNSNFILALNFFAKYPAGRVLLLTPVFNIERTLTALNNHTNLKIKANIARTFKSINTDPNEAIEEGTVASLIAMSLEGKMRNPASDDLTYPQLAEQELQNIPAPSCSLELGKEIKGEDYSWFEQVSVTKGGAAGKGPDPPEPPTAVVDGSKEYPNMAEEVDAVEVDGKTKMAFAKMPIPEVFRESYRLKDVDFLSKQDDELGSEGAGVGGKLVEEPITDLSPRHMSAESLQNVISSSGSGAMDEGTPGDTLSPSTTPSNEGSRSGGNTPTGSKSSRRGDKKKSLNLDHDITSDSDLLGTKSPLGLTSDDNSPLQSPANTPTTKTKSKTKKKTAPSPKEAKDEMSMSRQAQHLGLYN